MANYGRKYFGEFSSTDEQDYAVEILFKDYTGPVYAVACAARPVVHKWDTDNPKAPIKGSSVTVSLLNENSSLPLQAFYATEDDDIQIKIWFGGQLLFIGFVVLDDCSAPLIDTTHEFTLSANDNLGSLKKVALDVAITPASKLSLLSIITACLSQCGTEIGLQVFANIHETTQIAGESFLSQTYIDPGSFMKSDTEYDDCYAVLEKMLARFKCTLFQSLGLWTIIRVDDHRYYTDIPGYRYDENGVLLGAIALQDNFLYVAGSTPPPHETGILNRIFRPYQFTKETFNYKFPVSLLKNAALTQLGALVSDTVIGSVRYKVYQFPASSGWAHYAIDSSKIVIEYDTLTGKELQRYVRQDWYNYTPSPISGQIQSTSFGFNDIEVNRGDVMDLSFSYRASNSTTTRNFTIFINLVVKDNAASASLADPRYYRLVRETVGGDTHYRWLGLTNDYVESVNSPIGVNPASADITQWQSFGVSDLISTETTGAYSKAVPPMPANGLLKMFVVGWNEQGNQEKTGFIKDIRFSLFFGINDSTSVIGQTHTETQDLNIKDNSSEDIYVDDSPRNSISGTLYLGSNAGLLRKRTSLWKRDTKVEARNLGEITTLEYLYWRRTPRTMVEGNTFGLVQANHLSILSTIRLTMLPGLRFIFGMCEIDYRNDSVRGTLWEIAEDTEVDGDLISSYEFKYLYKTNE
jgi:hypothetical protein